MTVKKLLNDSEERLMSILKDANEPLSYKQLSQLTQLSLITTQRSLKRLGERRLVNKYQKGKEMVFVLNKIDELPTVNNMSVDEFLRWPRSGKAVTKEFWDDANAQLARLWIEPVHKIAAGKFAEKQMHEGREWFIEVAKAFERVGGTLRYIAQNLYIVNENELDNWLKADDYDPTIALEVLQAHYPKVWTKEKVDLILKTWREKKVG